MAFTQEEKAIIEYGKANGKSPEEISDAIFRRRNGLPSVSQETMVAEEEEKTTVANFLSRAGSAIDERQALAAEAQGRSARGEQTIGSGVLQTLGQGAAAVGDVALEGIKTLTPQVVEDTTGRALENVGARIAETGAAQRLVAAQEANPEAAANIEAGLGLASIIPGAGAVVKGVEEGLGIASNAVRTANRAVDGAESPVVTVSNFADKLASGQAARDVRLSLSEVDPAVENVLRASSLDEFNDYYNVAEAARDSNYEFTPLQVAGGRAVEALDSYNRKLSGIGADKAAVIAKAKNGQKDMTKQVADTRRELNRIIQATRLDGTDATIANVLSEELVALSANPTAANVDKFIDLAQDRIYTSRKNLAIPVSDKTSAEFERMVGKLNSELKDTVGGNYAELNQRYADMVKVRDQLNKALGAEGDKGGSLMKRVFSPSDGGTKRMFLEIKDETGIDLIKEATLAKFVMESVGDTQQRSLLDQLNLTRGPIMEAEITKPQTWWPALKEILDLDGRELGEAIIEQAGEQVDTP